MTAQVLAGAAAAAVLALGWALAALGGEALRRLIGLVLASFAAALLAASLGEAVEFKALALLMTVHAALTALIGAALAVRIGEAYGETDAARVAGADDAADRAG